MLNSDIPSKSVFFCCCISAVTISCRNLIKIDPPGGQTIFSKLAMLCISLKRLICFGCSNDVIDNKKNC